MRDLALAAAGLVLLSATVVLADDDGQDGRYTITNLVANLQAFNPKHVDSQLVNPWGVANAPNSPLWVSDNGDGLSTLYDGEGVKAGLVVTIPVPTGVSPPAAPTGLVWNPTTQFVIPPGNTLPATFMWATENGTIAGWNGALVPNTAAVTIVDNSKLGAVYKGLAFGTGFAAANPDVTGNFIYVTNFHAGTVEAYDSSFKPATLADGNFTDANIPAGFAPFGIANIDGDLFVTYAKQDAAKHDDVAGPGEGFVNVFSTSGKLLGRFASRGVLNSPWAIVRAPLGFGRFGGDILIGNFGNVGRFAGWINAFDSNGRVRELHDQLGRPLSIDGLWSLVFGTFRNSDGDTLYFTAGPNSEANGLFGEITPVPRR